ncbi:Sugar or nucleoside kinase, ribokinase family [Anaerovirgula multivorans]|uniref:Sugar or nucleoside kinase, ribokinase family n=1 Tax=Anaerovirgula multivorans TaxID=312168 RepID=A0A239C6V0_9FIRM|nr:fructoselysine 6-kinase [Anaerovirgula multivorans]SNS15957.1 Sugar or nucleoside kinase, ribokinase family [Anaerovirgula multivorans]
MLKVIGIGDNVCDIYITSNMMYPGGQALNFAVYAKQIGVETAYLGVFGKDEVANHVINTLNLLEVDHGYSRHYEGENGYAVVKIVDGDRIFVKSNKGGIAKKNPIVLNDEDKAYIKAFDLVHTSNNSYFNDQLKYVYETGVPISYDFSYKWEDWGVTEKVCPYLSYAFLSCGERSDDETKEICRRVHGLGCKTVVATMGSKGAWLYDGDLMLYQKPSIVKVVDTLGAGDSFATGFLVNYLRMKKESAEKIEESIGKREKAYKYALNEAAKFAARSCLVKGAFGHGISVPEPILKKIG